MGLGSIYKMRLTLQLLDQLKNVFSWLSTQRKGLKEGKKDKEEEEVTLIEGEVEGRPMKSKKTQVKGKSKLLIKEVDSEVSKEDLDQVEVQTHF